MSDFIANSQAYNITSENEIAIILSRFNSNYIFDVIKDTIQNRFSNYNYLTNPNVVSAFEQNFKDLQARYPSDAQNIAYVRQETYKEIINILCKEYSLQFNDNGETDYFTLALYLYDFLVANFNRYLTLFFANYIYKEKNNLYDFLSMESMKKNKDTSTIYNKKVYKDIKLAVLNANLLTVVASMSQFDISFENILMSCCGNKIIVNGILNYIQPIDDFYKNSYCKVFQTDFQPVVLTNIRLEIQKMISPDMAI